MRVRIAPESHGRIRVEVKPDGKGRPKFNCCSFTKPEHYTQTCKLLGVPRSDLDGWLDKFTEAGGAELTFVWEPLPDGVPAVFRLRRVKETVDADTIRYDHFSEALSHDIGPKPAAGQEWLITWEGEDQCCAVDVDFLPGKAPPPEQAKRFLERVRPTAKYSWLTKSGGLRLVYFALSPYTAQELACAALLHCRIELPNVKAIELKTTTRHPANHGAQVLVREPDTQTGIMSYFHGGSIEQTGAVAAYMEERGWDFGVHYPHTQCPFHPGPAAEGNNPVVPYPNAVKCYVCAENGVDFGYGAGRMEWVHLLGKREVTLFELCVNNYTHWEHAQHVVAPLFHENRSIAKACYAAALKLRHGDDPRIGLAFAAGKNVIRMRGYWASGAGEPLVSARGAMRGLLRRLPCNFVRDKLSEELVENPDTLVWLEQNTDLYGHGYPQLIRIWGSRIFSVFNQLNCHKAYAVQQVQYLRPTWQAGSRPLYLKPAVRLPLALAWEVINGPFPGINQELVALLIAAKGCVEGERCKNPMLFLTGPTGSGKSLTVQVAAAIAGDFMSTVIWNKSIDKLRAGIFGARDSGTYCCFDELVKTSQNKGASVTEAMDPILNFTPDSLSHKLYVGPVPLGQMPVCVWCDTTVPTELYRQAQLCRRLHHLHLPDRKDAWNETIPAHINVSPQELRLASPRFAEACDSLLSDVIDRWFPVNAPKSFDDIATELGVHVLEAADQAEDFDALIREFYAELCKLPCAPRYANGLTGRGWKLFNLRDEQTPLGKLWPYLRDDNDPTSPRKLSERDLRRVLGLSCETQFEARQLGAGLLAMRFVQYKPKHSDNDLVNEELRNA